MVTIHQYLINLIDGKIRNLAKIIFKIRGELDNEWNFIDSTIIMAHQHSVNSKCKNGNVLVVQFVEIQVKYICFHDQKIRANLADKDIQAIIPKRRNSVDKANAGFDKYLYKIRHLIENLFARLKQFTSIATRYDKSKNDYASFIYIAYSIILGKI